MPLHGASLPLAAPVAAAASLALLLQVGQAVGTCSTSGSSRGGFVSSVPHCDVRWTARTRTAREGIELTFPKGAGWADACFVESGCSSSGGERMTKEAVASWVEHQLLDGPDPFGSPGTVPIPWPEGSDDQTTPDQVALTQYVGYTRRQLCYIGAQALLGADTEGYANGLTRILATEVPHCTRPAPSVKSGAAPSALTGDFGVTLWHLMAACAADPTMRGGQQGPLVLVSKGSAPTPVSEVRNLGSRATLKDAHLSVCRYDDGDAGPVTGVDGLEDMSSDVCTPPTRGAPGKDFMTGGRDRPQGHAIQDISAKFLGGYVFGNACGLGGGQDERLMTYLPEVFIMTFFLSQHAEFPQLREPAWVLGARIIALGLDGSARFGPRLEVDPFLQMTSDLISVRINGGTHMISGSSPFLAFMSENQDFLEEGGWWSGNKTFDDLHPVLLKARTNQEERQRSVAAGVEYSFMYQVRAWYSAVAMSSYHHDIRPTLSTMIRALGTGPFLAGLWWGDSHLGFLAVYIAQAIAAGSWGHRGLPVEYYIYSDFTENPGNQCFVLGGDACRACLEQCIEHPLPNGTYWLPDYGFFGHGPSASCVRDAEDLCGEHGFLDVVAAYKDLSPAALWEAVESTLSSTTVSDGTVFDLLLKNRRLSINV